jgi:hypothetical protein
VAGRGRAFTGALRAADVYREFPPYLECLLLPAFKERW